LSPRKQRWFHPIRSEYKRVAFRALRIARLRAVSAAAYPGFTVRAIASETHGRCRSTATRPEIARMRLWLRDWNAGTLLTASCIFAGDTQIWKFPVRMRERNPPSSRRCLASRWNRRTRAKMGYRLRSGVSNSGSSPSGPTRVRPPSRGWPRTACKTLMLSEFRTRQLHRRGYRHRPGPTRCPNSSGGRLG